MYHLVPVFTEMLLIWFNDITEVNYQNWLQIYKSKYYTTQQSIWLHAYGMHENKILGVKNIWLFWSFIIFLLDDLVMFIFWM